MMVGMELARLVRETYSTAARNRDTVAAFERAVEIVAQALPQVSAAEARREVALALSLEPGEFGSEHPRAA